LAKNGENLNFGGVPNIPNFTAEIIEIFGLLVV
jgi:hypothetical protein